MSDISKQYLDAGQNCTNEVSKCSGGECPLKSQCYRYTAPDSGKWQSWLSTIPYNIKEKCDIFLPIKKK